MKGLLAFMIFSTLFDIGTFIWILFLESRVGELEDNVDDD